MPVPSRAALRTLQRIALAGATGGACCLGMIQHETRRRIRLAEKVVEQKRLIYTISSGRGKARADLMFEAAERGDNFLLDPSKEAKRRRKRRKFSALAAVAPDTGEDHAILQTQKPKDSIIAPPSARNKSSNLSNGEARRRRRREVASALATATLDVNKFYAALQSPQKMLSIASSRSTRYGFNSPPQTDSAFDAAVKPRDSLKKAPSTKSAAKGNRRKSGSKLTFAKLPVFDFRSRRPQTRIGRYLAAGQDTKHRRRNSPGRWRFARAIETTLQPKTDLITLRDEAYIDAADSEHREPLYGESPFIIPDLSSEHGLSFSEWIEQTEQNKQDMMDVAARDNRFTHISKTVDFEEQQHDEVEPIRCLDSLTPGPSCGHALSSIHFAPKSSMRFVLNEVGHETYRQVLIRLLQSIEGLETKPALACFESTLRRYAFTRLDPDLAIVKLLYMEFVFLYSAKLVRHIRNRIVREALSKEPPVSGVVALLYPNAGANPSRKTDYTYDETHYYLRNFCNENTSVEEQIAEAGKLLQGTKETGIECQDRMIISLIRSICTNRSVEEAQEVLDDFAELFDFQPTFYTITPLVDGFASQGNWTRIDNILLKLHEQGLSRAKVTGYANLVHTALQHYVKDHSPEQIYDFLTYYMHGYGLIATNPIASTAVEAFIDAGRYDLAQQWARERHFNMPELLPSTTSTAGALQAGMAWKRTNASVEDVVKSCRALALTAIRDPFSNMFRSVALEAVLNDVNQRINRINRHLGQDIPLSNIAPAHDLETIYINAHQMVSSLRQSLANDKRAKLLVDDLVRSVKAVGELQLIFEGEKVTEVPTQSTMHADMPWLSSKVQQGVWDADIEAMLPSIPEALKEQILPSPYEVQKMVDEYYVSREKQNLPPNHAILRYVVQKWSYQQNHFAAMSLLRKVYFSDWVQGSNGTPFTLEEFSEWLYLAFTLRSPGEFRQILWAVLDSTQVLNISTLFKVLARLARTECFDAFKRRISPAQLEEAEYLTSRLYHRRQLESGFDARRELFQPWQSRISGV